MKVRNFGVALVSLVFACSMFFAGPAAAERGHRGGKHNPEKMLQRMSEKLELTADQQAQVKAIFESHKPRMEELREQMKSTFTDEQREKMHEMRKNRKRGERGERPSKEERMAKFQELGISQGQMDQMKSLRQQMRTEREAIKNEISTILTPEQKAKAEEMKSKWKDRRHKRGPRGEGGGN